MSNETDLVILGGGSGGYATALRARQLGLTVTLVERDRLGGTCLHQGCVPTKALLHAAELADAAGRLRRTECGRRSTASTWRACTPSRTGWSTASTRA
jgi:pyruvate/2-oxoglutarate dehydrogenase complex dihydrolipoamide dehydrogenase (E3) component